MGESVEDVDDLHTWIYLFFELQCHRCGRWSDFPDLVEPREGEGWAWEFAKRAAVIARRDNWKVDYDENSYPLFFCGQCRSDSVGPRPEVSEGRS